MTKFILTYRGVKVEVTAHDYAAAKRYGQHIFRLTKPQTLAMEITKGELP